ncbi:hypothetical protein Dip510_001677 [Elusimicrobium posterum]|uniref:alpha-2-macroglobulin family protein n=1 Tax=Elusimicrobium posterum TaxID=3116653 RepID=UPI003C74D18D
MFKKLFALVFLTACAATLSAQSTQPLTIVSYTPKGSTYSTENVDINITFNKPVVKLGATSQTGEGQCPITLVPAAQGNCRWSGTQTLTFEATNLTPSTEYSVKVNKNFKSEISNETLGRDFTWKFNTERISIRSTKPYNNENWVSLNPYIFLVFNVPVNPQTAKNYITFETYHGINDSRPFSLIRPSEEVFNREYKYYGYKRENTLVLMPETLSPATKYQIKIRQGLMGEEGNLGLEKDYSLAFNTYNNFTFKSIKAVDCLPGSPELRFSNPVTAKDLVANIKISPSVQIRELTEEEGLETGNMNNGEGHFGIPFRFAEFKPDTKYKVTVSKNLKDIYGNTLGKNTSYEFTNPSYCPNMVLSPGFGVVESYMKKEHPVSVINIDSAQYRFTPISRVEDFISYLKDMRTYCQNKDNYYFGDSYSFSPKKNTTLNTSFDYSKMSPALSNESFGVLNILKKSRNNGRDCVNSLYDNFTDKGITLKTSPQNMLVWVTNLKDGAPSANTKVNLYDENARILWSGNTDSNGLAKAPGWAEFFKDLDRWSRPVIYAAAFSDGGDAVIANNLNSGVEPWRFNISYNWYPQEFEHKAAIFLDRDILKPGEKVNLKGLIRTLGDGDWELAPFDKGKLIITDPRGKEIVNENIAVNKPFRTFNKTVEISASAPTGYYNINFSVKYDEDEEHSYDNTAVETNTSFRVETAKAAEFKINLNTDKPAYTSNESAQFTVDAWYMFGAPLAGAESQVSMRTANAYYSSAAFPKYSFNFDTEGFESKVLGQQKQKLDDKGRVTVTQNMPAEKFPYQVFIEAGVTAPDRQQLFARKTVSVHPADFYFGFEAKDNYVDISKEFKANIIAVNPVKDEKQNNVSATLKIQRKQWYSVRKTALNGRLEWVSDQKVEDISIQTINTGKNGYDLTFKAPKTGNYILTVSAKDSQGREVTSSYNLYITGQGDYSWSQSNDDILMLEQDKEKYKVGDKAKIMVKSPYQKALALVTVEREGIFEQFTQEIKGGTDTISIPVKENYLPNVFVGVTLTQGRTAQNSFNKDGLDIGKPQVKVGYANLTVEPEARRIETKVKTNKDTYKPGEIVDINIETKVNGKAVQAEAAVFVVDEGVLALTGYSTPDLFNAFYGPRALSVTTADNRIFVIGQRSLGEKGENSGGGGSAEAKLGGVDLRDNFNPAPLWQANIITDAKGKAEASFVLPDNLTKFRIMVVTLTENQFGSGDKTITVNKPLMLKPSLPRFARLGDNFKCGIIVYNYDTTPDITITAKATGPISIYGAEETRTEKIEKGGFKEVLWDCQATTNGGAILNFAAKTPKESDGLSQVLEVNNIEKYVTHATSGVVSKDKASEAMEKPTNYIPFANNRAEAVFASTALIGLKGGIKYLLEYPYDCLEQKMSKALPVIASQDIITDFKLGDIEEYKKMAQRILDNVSSYQTSSGGYRYWTTGYYPDPYLTSYVLEVAHIAKDKGYKVDEAANAKALTWLESYANSSQNKRYAYPYSNLEDYNAKAYAVYVLSLYGKGSSSVYAKVLSNREKLSLQGKAHLLKASVKISSSTTLRDSLADDIMNMAKVAPTTMHFESTQKMPWLHGSNLTTTAIVLDAMLQAKGGFEGDDKAVRWIINQANKEGDWGTTAANAAVFRALDSYYSIKENVVPEFKAELKINSISAWTGQFKGREMRAENVTVPFERLFNSKGESKLDITKKGKGNLYYTLYQTYAPLKITAPVNSGFTVNRKVEPLYPELGTDFVAGQRAVVTITVTTSQDRPFVVVEDFLPAGFEIVDSTLQTESQFDADAAGSGDSDDEYEYSYWGGFERSEKYDDRIAIFADYLTSGTHTYKYIVQATAPGKYFYPAIWASQMYEPENYGHSTTTDIEVK